MKFATQYIFRPLIHRLFYLPLPLQYHYLYVPIMDAMNRQRRHADLLCHLYGASSVASHDKRYCPNARELGN